MASLREQGYRIAARTYRAWRVARQPADRIVSDAMVINDFRRQVHHRSSRSASAHPRGAVWAAEDDCASAPQWVPRHCGLHRRPVHAAPRRRGGAPRQESPHHYPSQGWPPRWRSARPRLHRPSAEPGLVADFTCVRTWLGFVYIAFILDVFAQRIVAWHAATSKATELVMIPLRMALWQRAYEEGSPG